MTEQQDGRAGQDGERQVVIVGPDGQPMGAVPESALAAAAAAAARDGDGTASAPSPTWSSSPRR